MKAAAVVRAFAVVLLLAALGLITWGGYGIATFPPEAEGSGYDPRFYVFDNGYYPAMLGTLLLLVGGGLCWMSRDRKS